MMLRILALLTALLAPITADAASRFWVGGTGTWDASDTTHWASSSGGAGGASVPGASDSAIFDGSSGGGTVTVSHASNTIQSLTMSAFTGTLDFATNDNNITLSISGNAFISTGSGTRTLNMGDGTWTLSGASAVWDTTGATNFTLNANGSTLSFSSTSPVARNFGFQSGQSLNIVSYAEASSPAINKFANAGTIATLNVGAGNGFVSTAGNTLTITNAMNFIGTAAKPITFLSNSGTSNWTISSANNLTCSYCAFGRVTFTGGGAATATNSFDLGSNSGITITAPSAGGAHVVGG